MLYLAAIIIISVLGMSLAIIKFKVHPAIAILLAAVAIALCSDLETAKAWQAMTSGLTSIMKSIGIVVVAGCIIGTVMQKTGAAMAIATHVLNKVGKKRASEALGITGCATGISVFCDSGFIILSPVAKAFAKTSKISVPCAAACLSAGLFSSHCLVPPASGPAAMAANLQADLGSSFLMALPLAIFSTFVGIVYAKIFCSRNSYETADQKDSLGTDNRQSDESSAYPRFWNSLFPIALPIFLIALQSIAKLPSCPFGTGTAKATILIAGNPSVALLLGLMASFTLIRKRSKVRISECCALGIKNSLKILAITGAGGVFGGVLRELPIAEAISSMTAAGALGLLIPYFAAAILKTSIGASSVAMILSSAMVAPLLPSLGLDSDIGRSLALMASGAGSMFVCHANDSYFWVVVQFSGMSTKLALKLQTGISAVQSVSGIAAILAASAIFL